MLALTANLGCLFVDLDICHHESELLSICFELLLKSDEGGLQRTTLILYCCDIHIL